MDLFNIVAILITLTALFSYINHRYIGLPVTIGVMLIALSLSLLLNFLGSFGFGLKQHAEMLLGSIQFDKTLLHGMLSFLLFAGALHININDLVERKWSIGSLATFGTIMSSFLVGTLTWWLLIQFGLEISYSYCLLFGALISPTDPIAVLGILKTVRVPKSLKMKIAGESLFNDGVGVVVFLVILEIATGTHELNAGHIGLLFVQETIGGALLGLGLGYLVYRMLKSVDNYQVEVLITLALVTGGYALADALHLSGPIAIVVAGLLIGNHGRLLAMSDETRHQLDTFWELVDEILNAVLFLLIGMEILILTFTKQYLLLSLLVIPFVLMARFISIGIPMALLRPFRTFTPGAVRVMTWGGLRGGISVALALSIPPCPERHVILALTYSVVLFSILVQGLTIEKLVKRVVIEREGEHP
ncbi:MAG: sodium:proton antiporter [Deltaproteobacteria bacterium]|nr:sodium:proton antiporter [Deltaproteobacteria bacterium]MBW2144514.1 sodium:proton antiporter [Deltaproteobacteria bacterium]